MMLIALIAIYIDASEWAKKEEVKPPSCVTSLAGHTVYI